MNQCHKKETRRSYPPPRSHQRGQRPREIHGTGRWYNSDNENTPRAPRGIVGPGECSPASRIIVLQERRIVKWAIMASKLVFTRAAQPLRCWVA
jgi:hypothetical protein